MPSFKEYQMMFQLSATTSGQFQSAFSGAQNQIAQLQSKIEALNRQQGDITAYTKQQQAVERTKAKLETLKQQYDNLKAAQEKAGGSDVDLQNKMLEKQLQIDRTNASLDQQTQKLDAMGNALNEAGVDTSNLEGESARLQAELGNLRQEQEEVADSANEMSEGLANSVQAMQEALIAAGLVDGLKAIGEALKQCAEASIQYETSMAGVKRTVGGSDVFIAELGDTFKELSTQIPITAEELAGIATTAGQLGIAQQNVESFTTVMAQLATTTDLTADDAATMLAQFANITGTTQYDRLGSTVAELGDATATTASKVVSMSQGMAAAASQAGFSETDILAVSAAVGSLGIEAQAGSTAMSTLISTLYKATETGNKLDEFAAVAGMTATEFKQAWAEDAVGTMNTFIQGLNDVERNGKSAVVILDELGINNVRQTKAILGLASAGDLLSNTIDQANAAWDNNTALTEKAGVMYGTTEAKLTMMQNAANNVKIAVGDALTPVIGGAADVFTPVLQGIAEFIDKNPALVKAITTVVGVVAGVTGGILALSAAMKVASAAAAIMTASIPGLPLILAITAGIAALAGGIVYLSSVAGGAGQSFEDLDTEFDDLMQQFDEQQEILDLADQYRDLSDELGITRSAIKDIQKAGSVGIHLTADVAESGMLTAEDFVDNTYVELTPEQASFLAAADFIPDGTLITLTAESGNKLAAAGFLDNQKVWLTAEAANQLLAKGYIDDDTLALYAEQGNYIEGEGFVTDTEIELTPEAAAYLASTDFLEGSAVQLTPEAAAYLEANGFLTGTEVELSPEAAAYLAAEGFLTGTDVMLTPEAAAKLAAAGFLDNTTVSLVGTVAETGILSPEDFIEGTTDIPLTPSVTQKLTTAGLIDSTVVQLTPEAASTLAAKGLIDSDTVSLTATRANELIAAGYLDSTQVTITGFRDGENIIPVEDFISTTTVTITPDLDVTELTKKLATLKSDIATVGSDLEGANSTLASLQSQYDELKLKFLATNDKKEKTALAAEMEEINETIAEQRGVVNQLQTQYDGLNAEYTETEAAVTAINEKEAQLAATKDALAAASNGVITATEGETEAFNAQLETVEALATAKQAELRAQLYDNATAQASKYAQAVAENNEMLQLQAPWVKRVADSEKYLSMNADQVNEAWANMLRSYDEMAAAGGDAFDGTSEEARNLMDQINALQVLMGDYYGDLSEYGDGSVSLFENFGNYTTNDTMLQEQIAHMNEMVATYGNVIADNQETIDSFIQNIIDGVKNGAITLEEAEGIVTRTLSSTENGAELVAQVMEQVNSAMEDAGDSAEEAADGMDEVSQSCLDLQNAVQPILDKMAELGQAYDDAYKSALDSADGQFELFEKVGKIKISPQFVNSGDNSMREGLESQAKYWEEYAAMLEKAQSLGVNSDLLGQLADGSAESAATLKRLVSESTTAEDIEALNASYELAQNKKAEFAAAAAEIQTNFSETMTQLEQQMAETISQMEMSGEAASNARSTFQAMATSADSMTPVVAAAYRRLISAAQRELDKLHAPSVTLPGTTGQYAEGTDYAAPGMALVGERGPELVMMNGGEQVFTAAETAAILANANRATDASPLSAEAASSGASYVVTLSPTYNVSGSANAAEIEAILKAHDAELIETVKVELADMDVDKARRSYV